MPGEAEREELARAQAALLRALTTGEDPPPGFDAEAVRAQADALVGKRRRLLRMRRPDLVAQLAGRYHELFDEFARANPLRTGRSLDEARRFQRWLRRQR